MHTNRPARCIHVHSGGEGPTGLQLQNRVCEAQPQYWQHDREALEKSIASRRKQGLAFLQSIGRLGLTNEYESSSVLHVNIKWPGSVLCPSLHRAQSFSNERGSAIPPRGRGLRIHTFAHVV